MGEPVTRLPSASLDATLVLQAAEGNRAAFEELYRRHAPAAWRLATAVAADPDDAADAVSEAFTRVFAALTGGRYAAGAPFRPYLLATTRNAAIDGIRLAGPTTAVASVDALEDPVPDRDPVLEAADSDFVAEAFRNLPERWRSVLWLTEVEGIPASQAGDQLGLTANGTAQLAVRARAGLRERYLQAHLRRVAEDRCRNTIERLGAYVAGSLAARDLAKVDQHVAGCETCAARRDELEDIGSRLRRAAIPVPLGLLAVSTTRWETWLDGVRTAADAVGAAAADGSRWAQRAAAGAAAIMTALGLVGGNLLHGSDPADPGLQRISPGAEAAGDEPSADGSPDDTDAVDDPATTPAANRVLAPPTASTGDAADAGALAFEPNAVRRDDPDLPIDADLPDDPQIQPPPDDGAPPPPPPAGASSVASATFGATFPQFSGGVVADPLNGEVGVGLGPAGTYGTAQPDTPESDGLVVEITVVGTTTSVRTP